MKILALETTERIGSLAIHDGDKVLHEKTLDDGPRTAQSVAPGVKELLDGVGWKVADLDLVAVTIGPGSFTGLRIGVTTAKTLAYAAGAAILGLDTLEVIAAQTPPQFDRVAVAVDAQRGEVAAATLVRRRDLENPVSPVACDRFPGKNPVAGDRANGFRIGTKNHACGLDFEFETVEQVLLAEAWLASLSAGTALSGPIIRKLLDRVPAGVTVVDEACRHPRATTVAELAARAYRAGRRDDLWCLTPKYSRRSAAEERWEERHNR